MRSVVFPFEKVSSKIFGSLYRPIAVVNSWSRRLREWREVIAIVDTGAESPFTDIEHNLNCLSVPAARAA